MKIRRYLIFIFCFAALCLASLSVSAAESFVSYFKDGAISINSNARPDGTHFVTFYNTTSSSVKYYTFQVPASGAPAGSSFLLTAPSGSMIISASVFWSSLDFTEEGYWDGSYGRLFLSPDEYELLSPAGSGSNWGDYRISQVAFDDISETFSDGFIYVTCSLPATAIAYPALKLTAPDPEPEPEPPDLGGVGGASSELGTFGTDDGTQNDIYSAFKRLYDSLIGIVSDDSVPDDYEDNLTVPEDVVPVLPDASVSAYSADASVSAYSADAYSSGGDYSEAAVIVSQYRAVAGETVYLDDYVDVSPYSYEIVESSQVAGQEYREGNFYALHYRVELPVRFVFVGHKGTAVFTPQFFLNMTASFNDSDGGHSYQYGEPSVYLLPDSMPYDMDSSFAPDSSAGVRQSLDGTLGFKIIDVPIVNNISSTGYRIVIEFPLYVYDSGSAFVNPNSYSYETRLKFNYLQYNSTLEFTHESDYTPDETLGNIYDEQKNQNQIDNDRYEEEQETIQEATGSVTEGLGAVNDTLSSWEIITMPVTIMSDFLSAITSSGTTVFTFPSFSVAGQVLWPSYSFDLGGLVDRFPLLFDSLHIISGILIVIWFVRYLWRKWSVITGDDLPMGEED